MTCSSARLFSHKTIKSIIWITGRPFGWILARRRTIVVQMLRGASYSVGAGFVSILTVWAQRHL
ncbi:hypothetical protein [Streptomyces sp. NPDC088725]|uniref:hypothetical protein n=1 Tax=Streptomyces sp. NPDC088725 TaxID=3365873 RepID=UPI0038197ECC